jgi:hypothetical protein
MVDEARPYSDSECDRLEKQAVLAGLENHLRHVRVPKTVFTAHATSGLMQCSPNRFTGHCAGARSLVWTTLKTSAAKNHSIEILTRCSALFDEWYSAGLHRAASPRNTGSDEPAMAVLPCALISCARE